MGPPDDLPIEIDPLYGCWRWLDTLDRDGYGIERRTLAHRAVYERLAGPIPSGHQLDHLCRRRDCVRPTHLEPVKPRENLRRRRWSARAQARECSAGHDAYTHGRRTPEGGLVCRLCDLA